MQCAMCKLHISFIWKSTSILMCVFQFYFIRIVMILLPTDLNNIIAHKT